MQVRLVEENALEIEGNVRPELKLDWRVIKFAVLLGSGTFGDCYKGTIGGQDVAVSPGQKLWSPRTGDTRTLTQGNALRSRNCAPA